MKVSEIMPVRFYKKDTVSFLDFSEKKESDIKLQEWLYGISISIQLVVPQQSSSTNHFKVYEDDNLVIDGYSLQLSNIGDEECYVFNIPTTVGKHIYSIEYGVNFNGHFNIFGTLITDCINVKLQLPDHIKIVWYNDTIKDLVRYESNYHPTTFIRAKYDEVTTEGDFETMTFSDGQKELLKSTQRKKYSLKAYLLRNSQAVSLSLIAGCGNIIINERRVIFDKPPQIKSINNEPINEVESDVYVYDWGMFNSY